MGARLRSVKPMPHRSTKWPSLRVLSARGGTALASCLVLCSACSRSGEAANREHATTDTKVDLPEPAKSAETDGPPAASASTMASAAASASSTPESGEPPKKHRERKPITGDGDRVYAKARHVWIQPAPQPSKGWLGYLTIGGSVRVKGGDAKAATVYGAGCNHWVKVEPRGFVCVGDSATLDPNDPEYLALLQDAPDLTSPWPYQYAESIGTPRYVEVPSAEQQRSVEVDLDRHRERLARARAAGSDEQIAKISKWLVGVDTDPSGNDMPELLRFGPKVREGRARVARGSTVAFSRAFDHDNRTWLLASDHAIVPKDRVRLFERSDFGGVELGGDVRLPLGFFRQSQGAKYAKMPDGGFQATDQSWQARSWVMVTGESETFEGTRYLATREPGMFAREQDVSIANLRKNAPFSPQDAEAIRGKRERTPGYRYTWVDISVLGGWMVAYEGFTPVFATLVSGGRGGIPYKGIDPLDTASTPTGTFRIDGKFQTATMVSSTDSSIVHADVQYVMNFHGPHALHGAYWHADWGELKSGGCVNLSPIDSKRIFAWSEPRIPEGWHGVRSVRDFGPATRVVVHE